MSNFKYILTWTLAICFTFSVLVFSAIRDVKAANYTPVVQTHAGIDDIGLNSSGGYDKSALLTVDISPIPGVTSSADIADHYFINIYDATTDPSHNGSPLVSYPTGIGHRALLYNNSKVLNVTFGKKYGITWNRTYDVIVDIRDLNDKTTGSVTKSQPMGPPPNGTDNATTDGQKCALQNLRWYPSGKNQVLLTWSLSADCHAGHIDVIYPNNNNKVNTQLQSLKFPNDHTTLDNAVSGKYTFNTIRSTDNVKIGEAVLDIELDQALIKTSDGDQTFDSVNNNENSNISGDKCDNLKPTGFGIININTTIAYAICELQEAIINFWSTIIGWVVSNILYPSLGLSAPTGYDNSSGAVNSTNNSSVDNSSGSEPTADELYCEEYPNDPNCL